MSTKKAQMEIMGLVIIIIMLAILSIIFLTFALRPSPSTTPILRSSTKADNLLNSIIRTSTKENQKMLDIIENSYITNDFTYLKQEINKIISKAIPNKRYSFKLLINQQKVLDIGDCKLGVSSTKTIKHNNNLFKFTLVIC